MKDSANPEDWKRYLAKFPGGLHAVLAQAKVASAEQEKRLQEIKEAERNVKDSLDQIREFSRTRASSLCSGPRRDKTAPIRKSLGPISNVFLNGVFAPAAKALIRQYEQQDAAGKAAAEEERRGAENAAKLREAQHLEEERKQREAQLAEAKKRAEEAKNAEELRRVQAKKQEELDRVQNEIR